MNGEGFTAEVKTGDKVSAGDVLMTFDLDYIRNNAENDITPVVVTNGQETGKQYTMTEEKKATIGETVIITASAK